MTVSEAFSIFKSELEMPERKVAQAAAAQQDMREQVSRHLSVPDSFLAGSYARHTKIDPLNDIDVFLVRNTTPTGLSTDGAGTAPAVALEQVATAVRRAYGTRARIKTQHRSINVELQGIPFGFDLVPAWSRKPDGFWIPDTVAGTWIPTNPEYHAGLMTDSNEASGKRLKPLVKMAKYWSRQNYDLLCSFHVELICREILSTESIPTWSYGMATILVGMQKYVGQPMLDPAYCQTRVDKELTPEELDKFGDRLYWDVDRAIKALKLENAGSDTGAIAEWTTIFLGGFPRP